MKKNMGGTDRILRFGIALLVICLYYFKVVEGTLAYVLLAFSGIFILTGFVGFCPLYTVFGVNSCKKK